MSDISHAVKQSDRVASPSLNITHSYNRQAVCNWSPVKLLRKHDATTLHYWSTKQQVLHGDGTGASILKGVGQQSPTFSKVGG